MLLRRVPDERRVASRGKGFASGGMRCGLRRLQTVRRRQQQQQTVTDYTVVTMRLTKRSQTSVFVLAFRPTSEEVHISDDTIHSLVHPPDQQSISIRSKNNMVLDSPRCILQAETRLYGALTNWCNCITFDKIFHDILIGVAPLSKWIR